MRLRTDLPLAAAAFRFRLPGPRLLLFLFFCGASFALYGNVLSAPMVFDDIAFFGTNYVSAFGAEFSPLTQRYWSSASFAHQVLLGGHGTTGLRAGNVLLHGLTAFTLTLFIDKLFAAMAPGRPQCPRCGFGLPALVGGLLYLSHPAAVYAVAYLVQRSTIMATLFSLTMWLMYLEGLQSGRRRWLLLSTLCYYLAVFSKGHAILAPLVPILLTALSRRLLPGAPKLPALGLTFAIYAAIAVAAVSSMTSVLGTSYEPLLVYVAEGEGWHERLLGFERIHWMSVLTQGWLFFKYLAIWIWPAPGAMSIDMREPFIDALTNLTNWSGIAAFLAFGLLGAFLLTRRGRAAAVGVGMLIVWGLFWVEFSTVRLQEPFVLYRSYLWMTGWAIVAAAGVDALMGRFRLRWVLPACLLVLAGFVWAAEQRLTTFGSEKLLWDDSVRLIERNARRNVSAERAYHNRGVAYAREGDFERAVADYDMSLSYNPQFYIAYFSRAEVYAEQGRLEQALDDYARVLEIRPKYSNARIGRAGVLERMGRSEEALDELGRACAERNMWACYLKHKRTNPTAEFRFDY